MQYRKIFRQIAKFTIFITFPEILIFYLTGPMVCHFLDRMKNVEIYQIKSDELEHLRRRYIGKFKNYAIYWISAQMQVKKYLSWQNRTMFFQNLRIKIFAEGHFSDYTFPTFTKISKFYLSGPMSASFQTIWKLEIFPIKT